MNRIQLRRSVVWCGCLAALSLLVVTAPEALAQFDEPITKSPPTPNSADDPPLLIQYGVLVVLVIGVIGLGILRSKREVRN